MKISDGRVWHVDNLFPSAYNQNMKNPDNKTITLEKFNLVESKELIDMNPIHIATVREDGQPSLSVASDVRVLDEKRILISNNEMIWTPVNIEKQKNVVLTSFNEDWAGLRMTGVGEYHAQGKYFDMTAEFKSEKCTPKGAIVITIQKVESLA